MGSAGIAVGAALSLIALVGCASRSGEATSTAGPPLRVSVEYQPGDPLRAAQPTTAPAKPMVVTLDVSAVTRLPEQPDARPLASLGALILDENNRPVSTSPPAAERIRLLSSVNAIDHEAFEKTVRGSWTHAAALPANTTMTLSLQAGRAGEKPPEPYATLLIVSPSAAGSDHPRLLLRDLADEADAPAPAEARGERTVVIGWPFDQPTGEFALLIPADRSAGVRSPSVWRVRVQNADANPAVAAESDAVLATLQRRQGETQRGRRAALAAMLQPGAAPAEQRRALLFVAGETDAVVTSEAAFMLDDSSLDSVSSAVREALAAAPDDAARPQFGWLIDRGVLQALGAQYGKNELPPATLGMLAAGFGEVGMDPTALAELAAASGSRDDFATRVKSEHLIRLDDTSPSARVRAFDWLNARGAAPKNYHPLGPANERRRAIEQYLDAPTTQIVGQP